MSKIPEYIVFQEHGHLQERKSCLPLFILLCSNKMIRLDNQPLYPRRFNLSSSKKLSLVSFQVAMSSGIVRCG